MSDARASAPWETIRAGLRLLATVWGVQIGFSVANRILWALLFRALTSSSTGISELIKLIGVISFVTEVAFTAIGVALAVAAARLRRFPLVVRETTPGNPYRGARDAGPARDPGLDGLATGVASALGAAVALGVASYVYNTLLAPSYTPDQPRGAREVLWALNLSAALAAGAIFTIWAARAAREVSRPLSPGWTITSFVALALSTGYQGWEMLARANDGHHPWAHWVGLALESLSTGVLILLALAVAEALRDQPRSAGA